MKTMSPVDLKTFSDALVSYKIFKYAFLSERFLLQKYFFDITSEKDFEFNPHYRGINVISDQETQSYVDTLFANEQVPRFDDLSHEFNAIVEFLTSQYSFSKVVQKTTHADGYQFDTPSANVKIKKHEPQPEVLPLRLRSGDPRVRTNIGERSDQGIRTKGKPGYLLHGPYIRLGAGQYEVSILGSGMVHSQR